MFCVLTAISLFTAKKTKKKNKQKTNEYILSVLIPSFLL